MQVNGVVEAVGTKFNGSLLVAGKWYNLKKGVSNPASVGTQITLELEPWKSKDKSGMNVSKVIVHESQVVGDVPTVPKELKEVAKKAFKERDFDAEARGKTRCSMFAAALSSPILSQYLYTKEQATLEDVLKVVREVADEGTRYTFGE